MGAIGLNPIRLDAIGLDPIRFNAIRLGVPGTSSATDRPYISPDVLSSLAGVWIADGKSNDDPDRAIAKNLLDPDNPFVIINASYTEGSGYADKDSPYYGAFVTDGVDDMIVSQNPVSEMLGGSNELTVVSMIHQITADSNVEGKGFTNYIRTSDNNWISNRISNIDKTGIYGYSLKQSVLTVINNILGDKNDYTTENAGDFYESLRANFSVEGFKHTTLGTVHTTSVAWYWTFIAKRVLTTDEINQVIAYYNLDKYVKPDIYYDVKKQGLTNDNHAQFGDKLIDYSGNSRDLQLFNIGWNLGSGIGKYVTNFGLWSKDAESNISYNSYSFTVNGGLKRAWLMWYVTELPSFKIKVSGINSNGYVDYGYYDNGSLKNFRLDKDGIHTLPPSGASSNGHGFKVNDTSLDWTGLVIEQIPDFAGALCFDGVDDFGQFVGDLGLKDYTVVADRAYVKLLYLQVPIISSLRKKATTTPFVFEFTRSVIDKPVPYSFGLDKSLSKVIDVNRKISYQSTYMYNGDDISRGTTTEAGDGLTFGRYGENTQYANIALWSFLLFPYSLSEFLLERQLKKHKLGTLYPGMVEFRPIVKSNIPYSSISYSVNPGEYVIEGSTVTITITLSNSSDKLVGISSNAISDITISGDNGVYEVTGKVAKSPQKISIVISSYLTMLGNDTLISNETLIKNE